MLTEHRLFDQIRLEDIPNIAENKHPVLFIVCAEMAEAGCVQPKVYKVEAPGISDEFVFAIRSVILDQLADAISFKGRR